jgi:adenine-specific DNA-methyltransferase
MPRTKKIETYEHIKKERINNPPVGLVTNDLDKDAGNKKYAYDPHIDPQLIWAGKGERTSFEVPTVSLHVHERIDPRTILEATLKRQNEQEEYTQALLFNTIAENPPIRDAIEFYKHRHGWSNRLIAGDSLLVMNSLLEKEGMADQVQMIYIDPPYGIDYSSNFQPFADKSTMSFGEKDTDLTSEPEMIKAFRDTWEKEIHSYLSYLRDRILLAHSLLNETGSIFLQISDENVHLVRTILDETFGKENFVSLINVKRASMMFSKKLINNAIFYIVWYAKNKEKIAYNQLFTDRDEQWFADSAGSHIRASSKDGKESIKVSPTDRTDITKFLSKKEGWKLYRLLGTNAQGLEKRDAFIFKGKEFFPPNGTQWKYSYEGLKKLALIDRLEIEKNCLSCKVYLDDFPVISINNLWEQIGPPGNKVYIVQTPDEIIKRCILMTTQPGDLVLDPTCGGGTTAYVAEKWGRRWITCDTSRISITLAKQRLMTSLYDFFKLSIQDEGIDSGLKYKTVPHITLGSLANNEPPKEESLYDQPLVDRSIARVSGPFTVEAVPSLNVKPLSEIDDTTANDKSISRSGETLRQAQWREELLKTGIRAKTGNILKFSRIETLPGTRWLHADAETLNENPQRVVVSFGPEYAPLEQRQVELAIKEAEKLVPAPTMVAFAAFQFDPEAAKDIDQTQWPGVTLVKVQMNTDLLTEDLKKNRASNESFWFIGQPDAEIIKINDGQHAGKYQVKVAGFDYYDPRTGTIESGGLNKIVMWMLDTDYDGRSIYPRQVFFPMENKDLDWTKISKNLRAEIDEELIEAYRGDTSLPFEAGENKQVAIKIVDDRGIESLKIIEVR